MGFKLGLMAGKEDPPALCSPAKSISPNRERAQDSYRLRKGIEITEIMLAALGNGFELNDHDGVPLAFRGCPTDGPTAFLRLVNSVKKKLERLLMEVEELIGSRVDKWSLGLVPPKVSELGGELFDGEKAFSRRGAASGGYCRFTRCYKNKRTVPAFSGLPRLLYCSRRVWLILEAAQLIKEGRAISWATSSQRSSSNIDDSERSSGGCGSESSEEGEGEGEGHDVLVQRVGVIQKGDQSCGVA